jgi:two-component sensor histidine kinase
LEEVVLAELAPYVTGEDGNVAIEGPPIMLKPRAALILSLVIHELMTTAAKYGALSVDSGRIAVNWTIAGSGPRRLELSWIEQGGPKIGSMARHGFGTELIERGISFELQGQGKLDVVDGALHCTISVPADPEHLAFASAPSMSKLR